MQLPPLYYLERYRNKGTRTYSKHSSYTEAKPRYTPESDHKQFILNMYQVPISWVNIYTANPSQLLKQTFVKDDTVNFCIHPQVIESYPEDPYVSRIISLNLPATPVNAIPSSSTRTLFIHDSKQSHAVKVHFPFKVSRYTRKMRDEVVEQAIRVSQELEDGIDKLGADFAFLREVIGITFKDITQESRRQENWGFLVRDMTPYPPVTGEYALVPGFALYGEDYYRANSKPLILDLIGDREPVGYVLNQIMLPIIRHWIGCFRHFGYLLEPHGQNVLLEVDKENNVNRIVHRDLSVGIDMRRRNDMMLSSKHLNNYNRMNISAFHSICFDRFMGSHFFDRIVKVCLNYYPNIREIDFTQPCIDTFKTCFPEHKDYFPKNIWYFSEERDEYNKPLYEDTGERPQWRPD